MSTTTIFVRNSSNQPRACGRHAHCCDYSRSKRSSRGGMAGALLRDSYSSELDRMLERALAFLEVLRGTPVLLSILIMCLGSQVHLAGCSTCGARSATRALPLTWYC